MSQTLSPLLNTIVKLRVLDVTEFGAFVATDYDEDLLIPQGQIQGNLNKGDLAVVYVFHEEATDRILGSTKLYNFLPETVDPSDFKKQQAVGLTVFAQTELGYKVIIEDICTGLLFHSDALRKLNIGDHIDGFIKHVRDDGKVDVCMQIHNKAARHSLEQTILNTLEAHNGLLTITDKSSPEDIKHTFNVSKGSYKKALGSLYKQKKILIQPDYIKLL